MNKIQIKLKWFRPRQYGYFEGKVSTETEKYDIEALIAVEVEEELGGRQYSTIDIYETYIYDTDGNEVRLDGEEYDDIIDELKENIEW